MSWAKRTGFGLLAASACGCHMVEKPQPLAVRVIDAETRSSVAGATVHVSAVHGSGDDTATAGKDGVAPLNLGRDENEEWAASVTAAGYLPEAVELPAASGHPANQPHEIALFAGPSPSVRMTVPDGYRGPVVLTATADPNLPPAREFTATVSAAGEASISGPPVVTHLVPSGVTAAYADGKPIPLEGGDRDVRFQWIKTAGLTFTFFVGTREECDRYRKTLEAAPHFSGGSPGGVSKGGRGGRHGGGRRGGGGGS